LSRSLRLRTKSCYAWIVIKNKEVAASHSSQNKKEVIDEEG
jgi:hypothetical protein